MATYTYDAPGVSVTDTIRFLLQDTDADGANEWQVSNEEIWWTYNLWYPLYHTYQWVASVIADTIAARYAREASYSADGVSISLGPVGEQYRTLAAALRAQHLALHVGTAPDVGGMTPGEELEPFTKPFSFGKGMHDDLEAGAQDYGGVYPDISMSPHSGDPNRLVEP